MPMTGFIVKKKSNRINSLIIKLITSRKNGSIQMGASTSLVTNERDKNWQ
jgi:hypothetical protein